MFRNLLVLFILTLIPSALMAEPVIYLIDVATAITPVTVDYIDRSIADAEANHAECLIIRLDTPGGLVTSMRLICKSILASEIPVVVYVAPGGSQAASAGVFVTMSAHVAAMAPGTNIGAAHPVTISGPAKPDSAQTGDASMEKMTNDLVAFIKTLAEKHGRNAAWGEAAVRESVSITENEALELKVIDLIAANIDSLLKEMDGRVVETVLGADTLTTAHARLESHEMGWRFKILDALSNPNVTYILFLIGLYGIFFELQNPGAILPGVAGFICIVIAFYSLQTMPVNYAGMALIIFGIILFILEVKVHSFGLLTISGIISLILGSIMLIDSPEEFMRISWKVIFPAAGSTALFFLIVIGLGLKAQKARTVTGNEGLIGAAGTAKTDLNPQGKVFVHGEIWQAYSEQPIEMGSRIKVVDVTGLTLKVDNFSSPAIESGTES